MKLKKLGIGIIAAVIIAVLCFAGGALWSNGKDTEPVITSELLSQELIDISELATVNYLYTNMGKFEDVNNFYGWEVPFTKKRFIVSYNGEIKAGVDMKDVKVSVKEKKITITLPEAKILSHSIDQSSLQLFDEKSYVFNQLKIKDYTAFVEKETKKMETKAIAGGLLNEAQKKAEKAVRSLVKLFGTEEGQYEIVFK